MASFSCIIYVLLLLLLENTANSSSSSESEREALAKTGWWGNQTPFLNGVASKQHHCTWTGIRCSEAGRVVSIHLGGYHTRGDELGKLNFSSFPYLQTLDRHDCKLNGSIPYQMLSKLTYLSLWGNNLSGKVPHQIGMLSKLTYLSLSGNNLSGKLPSSLSNLTQLQTLDLSNCELNGIIPYKIGMLSKLTYLSLRGNNLSGKLPFSLGNLNHLTGFIPSEPGLPSNLEYLYLQHNRLTGTIPSALGSLTKLKYMDLSANHFSGSLDIKDANLTYLISLDVSYNSLTGSIPVFKCNSLQYLSLSGNLLSGQIPKELGNCHSLYSLNLDNNNLTGSIPDNIRRLGNLELYGNPLLDTLQPITSKVTSHRRKLVSLVICIVLPITMGLFLLILACVFFCRKKPIEKKTSIHVRTGDICSVLNYDGNLAYEDIIKATNNFDIRYCIGTGGYGSVYEARLPKGNTVALKKLHRLEAEDPNFDRSFRNEVHVLSNIRHKNIVKLYGF